MNKYKFEAGKTYKTRDGRDALIYCVNAPGDYPIHGRIGELPYTWTLKGSFIGSVNSTDLMPPEPVRLREKWWVNVSSVGTAIYSTKKAAGHNDYDDTLRTAVPCWLVEIMPGEEGYEDE